MRKRVLAPGRVYGNVTILGKERPHEGASYMAVRVRCNLCGREMLTYSSQIGAFEEGGCPECRRPRKQARRRETLGKSWRPQIGRRFGELVVLDVQMKRLYGQNLSTATCQCDCGNVVDIPLSRLRYGGARTCGHGQRKQLGAGAAKLHAGDIDGTNVYSISGRRTNKNNSSGHTGVSYNKSAGKWRAYIYFRRKQYSLGQYDNYDDAVAARKRGEEQIYGPFLEWYEKEYGGKK